MAGMALVAALVAVGVTVAALPTAHPTDAIPRAATAREAIREASALVREVEERVDGADLVDRNPERAATLLVDAHAEIERAAAVGVAADELAPLRGRVERRLDALHRVARIEEATLVADLADSFEEIVPADMVAASDGSLWVLESGRGRIIRIDPADGSAAVVYRAGQALESGDMPGDPWLIATAATDVIVIDRERVAWRIDLAERIPRRMVLNGADRLGRRTSLIGALQHRPPLEIFNLYVVDGRTGELAALVAPGRHSGQLPRPTGALPDR